MTDTEYKIAKDEANTLISLYDRDDDGKISLSDVFSLV